MFEHSDLEAQRERLNQRWNHPEAPPQAINNYYVTQAPKATNVRPLLLISGLLIFGSAALLGGMQIGYARAGADLSQAQSEAAIAKSKLTQVKSCVEAIQ